MHQPPIKGIAARAGRWSAQHRKKAIWGWLAFVLVCVSLGMNVAAKDTEPSDLGTGESQTADRATEDAGFPDNAVEQVLVQARPGGSVTDPGFKAAVAEVTGRLAALPHVAAIKSPFDAGVHGQLSKD